MQAEVCFSSSVCGWGIGEEIGNGDQGGAALSLSGKG